MTPIKEELTSLVQRMPNDASIEDLQYQLYVIEKVRAGLEAVESEGGLTQDDVEQRMSKWLI